MEYENPANYLDLRSKWRAFADASCDVVYASHVFEHLTVDAASHFLHEARRVLRWGGALRIIVPDLRVIAEEYLDNAAAEETAVSAADRFLYELNLHRESTYGSGGLKYLVGMLQGFPHQHKYMYDKASLRKIVTAHGFSDVTFSSYGTSSKIPDIQKLECTREGISSLYLEAEKSANIELKRSLSVERSGDTASVSSVAT